MSHQRSYFVHYVHVSVLTSDVIVFRFCASESDGCMLPYLKAEAPLVSFAVGHPSLSLGLTTQRISKDIIIMQYCGLAWVLITQENPGHSHSDKATEATKTSSSRSCLAWTACVQPSDPVTPTYQRTYSSSYCFHVIIAKLFHSTNLSES